MKFLYAATALAGLALALPGPGPEGDSLGAALVSQSWLLFPDGTNIVQQDKRGCVSKCHHTSYTPFLPEKGRHGDVAYKESQQTASHTAVTPTAVATI